MSNLVLTTEFYGETYHLTPTIGLYDTKDFMGNHMPGLAIQLTIADGNEAGIPFGNMTVSFGEFIGQKNCAYVDTNNLDCMPEQLLQKYPQYFTKTDFTKRSGFCEYPLWHFSDEFIKACCNNDDNDCYQTYSTCYDNYMNDKSVDWEGCDFI